MPLSDLSKELIASLFFGRFLDASRVSKAIMKLIMDSVKGSNPVLRLSIVMEAFTPHVDRWRFGQAFDGASFLFYNQATVREWRTRTTKAGRGAKAFFALENILDPKKPNGNFCIGGHIDGLFAMLERWNAPAEGLPPRRNMRILSGKVQKLYVSHTSTDPLMVTKVTKGFDAFFHRIANHPTFVSDKYLFDAFNLWRTLPPSLLPAPGRVLAPSLATSFLTGPGRLLALSRVAADEPEVGLRVFDFVFSHLGAAAITADADAGKIFDNVCLLMPTTAEMTMGGRRFAPSHARVARFDFVEKMAGYVAASPALLALLQPRQKWRELWSDVVGQLYPEAAGLLAALAPP